MSAFLLTFQLMIVATLIAGVIGLVGAWAIWTVEQVGNSRSGFRWLAKMAFVGLVVSLALPLVLHAAAWEATAGKFGWLVLTQTGARGPGDAGYAGLGGVFGGLVAAGWIHGVHGSVIVALATWAGVRRTPTASIEQSELEVSPSVAFWRTRLPIARAWVVTALLAVAALCATEMTVVDLYGYRTVTDLFYLHFAIDASLGSIGETCLVPFAFVLLVLFSARSWLFNDRNIQESYADPLPDAKVADANRSGKVVTVTSAAITVGFSFLIAIVPVVGLLIKLGHQVTVVGSQRHVSWSIHQCMDNILSAPGTFDAEYKWTAMIALSSGAVALLFGACFAVLGNQRKSLRRWIDVASIAVVLIPGPVVGLWIVRAFQVDFPGLRTLYHQTLIPTCLALLFRSGPVAYWVIRATYQGIGDRVMESAETELSLLARLWIVDRQLLLRGLATAFLAAAIVASGDVPAMLPVIPPGVTTVGTRLYEQLHSGARYQEASLAIWYVLAVSTVATLWVSAIRKSRGRMM